MIPVELAVATGLTNVFVADDTYMMDAPGAELSAFLAGLTPDELGSLQVACRGVVPLLGLDLPRLRAFADGAVQVDLVEALDSLVTHVKSSSDVHLLEDLAALALSPRAETMHRRAVESLSDSTSVRESLRRSLKVRLGSSSPHGDLEHVLNMQLRPAGYNEHQLRRVAPAVYVAEDGAEPGELWAVIAALTRAGARVRRLPAGFAELDVRDQLSDLYPIVFWSSEALSDWTKIYGSTSHRGVHVGSAASQLLGIPRLINQVAASLPGSMSLKHLDAVSGSIESPLHIENLCAGAFDSAEMAYLGGASKSTVQRLSREGLEPRIATGHKWTFDQLITLRLIQAIRSRRRVFRDGARQLLARIEDLTVASQVQEVGLDASGNLYIKEDDGYRNIETNQRTFDIVVTVDQAFQSFQFGGGTVPNLLSPGPRVAVHPQILAGAPSVREKRIQAAAVEWMFRERGEQVLRSSYPELTAAEIRDARRVGQGILQYRAS